MHLEAWEFQLSQMAGRQLPFFSHSSSGLDGATHRPLASYSKPLLHTHLPSAVCSSFGPGSQSTGGAGQRPLFGTGFPSGQSSGSTAPPH